MLAIFIARLARVSRLILALALLCATFSYLSAPTPALLAEDIPVLKSGLNPQSQVHEIPAVEGWVKANSTGDPIAGASIAIGSSHTLSGADGYFSFTSTQLNLEPTRQGNTFVPLRVEVEAPSYGRWSLPGAKFYPGDTMRLHPKLSTVGEQRSKFGSPIFSYNHAPAGNTERPGYERLNTTSYEANATALTPPATIRVYRTATGVVEVIPFREYIKHVLPNEWVPSWGAESLKAGAMAVKSYAWYWISLGGKQVALGADLKDNVDDQVYDPNISYASTDAAVDATFNYAITRGGSLFQAQYCAGNYRADPAGDCPWPSQYLTQWGSSYHADQGRSWGWILQYYYSGSVITPSPPGGGYTGPPPTQTPVIYQPAPPVPPSGAFTVGQGSARADVFQAAFESNGGPAALGRPTGPVRWWMQYISEFNVVAQPFSGADGRGNVWLVYDVLKATDEAGHRAYLLNGNIAAAYSDHNPPGPEWIGAPTSDPYNPDPTKSTLRSQGFSGGSLVESDSGVQYLPWQEKFSGWRAEYFPGHQAPSSNLLPPLSLPGRPSAVRELADLRLNWPAASRVPQTVGAGSADWSAQFTRVVDLSSGTYDFQLRSDSGVRLWIDGLLAINGWTWNSSKSETYTIALNAGTHTIRVQYFSPGPSAILELVYGLQGTTLSPVAPSGQVGQAAAKISVQWIGRGAAPADSWVQPLTLLLSNPGDAKVLGAYRGTTDRNGVAVFQNLPPGTFNVHVKGPHSLQSARATVALKTNSVTEVDMKVQVEGDTDGDNCVTIADYSFVQAMVGAHKDTPGYNPAADLNGDGVVSMTDVSLLRSGFDKCGDISADNEFQPLALLMGPTLTQQMSPWLNPEQLQKGLGLNLVSSSLQPRNGEVVEIRVQAATGSQAVDGASFLLRYDPSRLTPVDGGGQAAKGVEPGVALPSVMGNWIDTRGGLVGYSAGFVQGTPPSGDFTVATLRFRVIGSGSTTTVGFDRGPAGAVQLTNGGTDLLGQVVGLTLNLQP
jgi:hypothetical protein